jgi:hypothetical protein
LENLIEGHSVLLLRKLELMDIFIKTAPLGLDIGQDNSAFNVAYLMESLGEVFEKAVPCLL